MKTVFVIYIIGFIISGIVYKLLYMIDSFYQHRSSLIDQAKSEINNTVVDIDNDSVIQTDIILTMFFSYLGILHILIAVSGWIMDGIMNKN